MPIKSESISPAEMAECRKILDKLMASGELEPFLEPVPWKDLGLDDYPKVIKKPMDFGTIKKKLVSKSYSSSKGFVDDVKQIWKNCMTYNADGSDFYKLANKWDKRFDKDVNKHLNKPAKPARQSTKPTSKPTPSKVKGASVEDKAQFCQMVYQLNEDQLGVIVKTLDTICESSLDKSKNDEVEINVDAIDLASFKKVDALIKDFSSQNKKKRPLSGSGAVVKKMKV